jgi:hypothetical protein
LYVLTEPVGAPPGDCFAGSIIPARVLEYWILVVGLAAMANRDGLGSPRSPVHAEGLLPTL